VWVGPVNPQRRGALEQPALTEVDPAIFRPHYHFRFQMFQITKVSQSGFAPQLRGWLIADFSVPYNATMINC